MNGKPVSVLVCLFVSATANAVVPNNVDSNSNRHSQGSMVSVLLAINSLTAKLFQLTLLLPGCLHRQRNCTAGTSFCKMCLKECSAGKQKWLHESWSGRRTSYHAGHQIMSHGQMRSIFPWTSLWCLKNRKMVQISPDLWFKTEEKCLLTLQVICIQNEATELATRKLVCPF